MNKSKIIIAGKGVDDKFISTMIPASEEVMTVEELSKKINNLESIPKIDMIIVMGSTENTPDLSILRKYVSRGVPSIIVGPDAISSVIEGVTHKSSSLVTKVIFDERFKSPSKMIVEQIGDSKIINEIELTDNSPFILGNKQLLSNNHGYYVHSVYNKYYTHCIYRKHRKNEYVANLYVDSVTDNVVSIISASEEFANMHIQTIINNRFKSEKHV